MPAFKMKLGKHRKITEFECVGACFADLECINLSTKYPAQWRLANR
jgi:hypothetical protein